MAGEFNAVLLAKIVYFFGEVFEHERLHALPVFIAERLVTLFFGEQQSERVQKVLFQLLAEILFNHGGVSGVPTEILRLVGEKALYLFGEVFAVTRFVRAVGEVEELFHNFGI